jgi:hypothetical protein
MEPLNIMSVNGSYHIPVDPCLQAATGSTHGCQQSDNLKGLRTDPVNISLHSIARVEVSSLTIGCSASPMDLICECTGCSSSAAICCWTALRSKSPSFD